MKMSLANGVTIFRLFLIPLCLYFLCHQFFIFAAITITIFGLLDGVDGYLARRYHEITKLGIFLDPLADKLLVLLVSIYFTIQGLLPMWFILCIFYRDCSLLMGLLALIFFKKEGLVSSISVGKISAGLNFFLMLLLCLCQGIPILYYPIQILLYISTLFIVVSFFTLSRRWFRLFEGKDL